MIYPDTIMLFIADTCYAASPTVTVVIFELYLSSNIVFHIVSCLHISLIVHFAIHFRVLPHMFGPWDLFSVFLPENRPHTVFHWDCTG